MLKHVLTSYTIPEKFASDEGCRTDWRQESTYNKYTSLFFMSVFFLSSQHLPQIRAEAFSPFSLHMRKLSSEYVTA